MKDQLTGLRASGGSVAQICGWHCFFVTVCVMHGRARPSQWPAERPRLEAIRRHTAEPYSASLRPRCEHFYSHEAIYHALCSVCRQSQYPDRSPRLPPAAVGCARRSLNPSASVSRGARPAVNRGIVRAASPPRAAGARWNAANQRRGLTHQPVGFGLCELDRPYPTANFERT